MKNIVDSTTVSPIIKYRRYILFLILAIAAAIRFRHMQWGLPDLYEEAMPFRASYDFWNWDARGITLNPSNFIYPALTYYLNFLAQAVVFIAGYAARVYPDFSAFQQMNLENVTAFVTIGRCISMAFDLGTIIMVYLLGKQIMDSKTGLLAGLFVALNPLHIKESNLINVDTPLTFFILLALYSIFTISIAGDKRWYLFAGLSIGLAAASKYSGGLLTVFLLIAQMINSGNLKDGLKSLKNVNLWYSLLIALGVFLLFNPYILLRFGDFMAEFNGTVHHVKYGHPGYDPNIGTAWYDIFSMIPQNLGWSLFIVVLASIVYAWMKKSKQVLVLLIFPVIYLCAVAAMSTKAERCLLPIFPILILSGAAFLISVYDQFAGGQGRTSGLSPSMKWGAIAAVLIIVLYFPVQGIASYSRKFTNPDTRALAKQVIINYLPQEGVVASGSFGINFPPGCHVFDIPFNTNKAEQLAPFYDLRWYRDFDLVVVSSYGRDLYRSEPARFQEYLEFYESLKAQATLIDSISSTDFNNGPSFWIYRPPSDSIDTPFDPSLIAKLSSTDDRWETANFMDDLGMFLSAKGKYVRGEQALQYAADHDSQLFIARQHLGSLQMMNGKYEEAANNFRAYLKRNPTDARMQCAVGDAMYELNRLDEAEKNYLAAVAIDGAFEEAYRGLVRVYTDKHDDASMVKILERYLTYLPPTSGNAIMIKQKILELKQGLNK